MELTPFEKLAAHREKMKLQTLAINALMDLIEQAKTSEAQIKRYTQLRVDGDDAIRDKESGITAEAIKDLRAFNAAIALICESIAIEA